MDEIQCESFLVAKSGESLEDCQDSIYPRPGQRSKDLFVVADGVTTSFHARRWARQLTRCFSEDRRRAFADWKAWLERPQTNWLEEIRRLAEAPDAKVYTKNDFAARTPAAATFAGLEFDLAGEQGTPWRALVLGDSCVFHLRAGGHVESYPLQRAEEFSYVTDSAKSYPEADSTLPRTVTSGEKDEPPDARSGDAFLLTTDAFAKWLLGRAAQGAPVWGSLLNMRADQDFTRLIDAARADPALRLDDDDVALVSVRFGTPHECYVTQRFMPMPVRDAKIGGTAGSMTPTGPSATDQALRRVRVASPEPPDLPPTGERAPRDEPPAPRKSPAPTPKSWLYQGIILGVPMVSLAMLGFVWWKFIDLDGRYDDLAARLQQLEQSAPAPAIPLAGPTHDDAADHGAEFQSQIKRLDDRLAKLERPPDTGPLPASPTPTAASPAAGGERANSASPPPSPSIAPPPKAEPPPPAPTGSVQPPAPTQPVLSPPLTGDTTNPKSLPNQAGSSKAPTNPDLGMVTPSASPQPDANTASPSPSTMPTQTSPPSSSSGGREIHGTPALLGTPPPTVPPVSPR